MEQIFDRVSQTLKEQGRAAREKTVFCEDIHLLETYMDSGHWLADYELDEASGLPKDLKRGVLSQDALYDLLAETRT